MSSWVSGSAVPILMIEVSLGYSWPMDSPRMEASGFRNWLARKSKKKTEKHFWQVPPPSKEKSSTRVVRHSIPKNRISIILLLNGCAAVTILGADPFNSILKMEMNIRLKQNLGKLFVWRKFFNLKGKQKWGHQILLDKLSSTRTLLIIDTMAPRSHGPSRWRSP